MGKARVRAVHATHSGKALVGAAPGMKGLGGDGSESGREFMGWLERTKCHSPKPCDNFIYEDNILHI
ncbi:hypothetical protein V6N13_014608 [Hibiscus sabdariffa]